MALAVSIPVPVVWVASRHLPRSRRRGLGAAGTLAGEACGAPVLSAAQLEQLAQSAGFPASLVPSMASIALRESGGCPTAYNPVAPDKSYGLWQINILGNPGILAALGLSDASQLFDPQTNAAAAAYLYNGNAANIGSAWAATAGPLPASAAPGVTLPGDAPAALTDFAALLPADLTTMDPVTLALLAAAAGALLGVVLS